MARLAWYVLGYVLGEGPPPSRLVAGAFDPLLAPQLPPPGGSHAMVDAATGIRA
ncbi:hypothetical protein [Sorangium sp. So ce1151]|uniref:hypothetical protein n=1 Tax=Sorangium sp. So ce1151 TaxID=3133332 RepID=UPI003F6097B9